MYFQGEQSCLKLISSTFNESQLYIKHLWHVYILQLFQIIFLHFIPVLISCLHLFSVMCSTLLWATQKAWLSLIVLQEVGEGMCPLLLLGACLNASSFAESMCPLASCSLITSKSPECSLCNPAIVNLSGEGGAGYVVRL